MWRAGAALVGWWTDDRPLSTRSTDGGATWSTDVRLDAGPDREWYDAAREIEIAVDGGGNVPAIWVDERNDPDTWYTGCASAHDEFDTYAAYSTDAGETRRADHNVLASDGSI